MTIFQTYIQTALRKARYEFDHEQGNIIGYIEELPLCWAEGKTFEDVRNELESVIEGWALLTIQQGESLPELGSVSFFLPPLKHEREYA